MTEMDVTRRLPWSSVWLLNADYLVLNPIDWQRAVTMLAGEIAVPFKVHPTFVIRSKHLTIPFPEMIALRNWVERRFPFKDEDSDLVSRRDILRRDSYTCGYCGEFGDTIDHILPESRGGENIWANLITACKQCNNDKDDRTPEEAGMKLLWNPKNRGLEYPAIQAEVWRILETQYGSNLGLEEPLGVALDPGLGVV